VKVVYLLGADDYKDEDVPADAFVIYQVGDDSLHLTLRAVKLAFRRGWLFSHAVVTLLC
jgi:hypothetical protein